MEYIVNMQEYGYRGECPMDVARVTAVHKERYELIGPMGELYGFLKPGSYRLGEQDYPTAGDFVRVEYNASGDSRIVETLPRRSIFSRREAGPTGREQAVAANFDYALLVTSLNRDFNPRRLERYLTVAFSSGATPVVLLTKADLCLDHAAQVAEVEAMAPGVAVHALSSYTGEGMEALERYVRPGVTLVLLGSSGVGKSSLINALAGEALMKVNVTRQVDASKGRHTTTHRQLLRLPGGALMIDTPGMRQLGLWCAGAGLTDTFEDVEEILARGCRFADCRHETEPGCAVRGALESGELDAARWRNYEMLLRETRIAEDRQAAMRDKAQRFKEIAKKQKEINKSRHR